MPTLLVTGASRGLGLEFTRQFAASGWRIHAACRSPSAATDLAAVSGDVTIHQVDVTDGASVAALKTAIGDEPIDVLLNNAGVIGSREAFDGLDYEAWAGAMDTNIFGPMRMAQAFMDKVLASDRKQMVFISSKMGSIALTSPNAYVYRSSKAGLNMAVACLAMEKEAAGLTAILFHPGHVQTDMGGAAAPLTPPESVAGMKSVIEGLTPADNGTFKNYDGTPLPW